jgi:hypothetical protein
MSSYLSRYYNKKVIILLDEYDTPMQEAYVHGFWNELTAFIQSIFNATFKTNPYIERAVMTGITRVSRESIFSDLNNLEIITTTSTKYETAFGFTEKEVFLAMEELGFSEKEEVKRWYDGFTFGNTGDVYNPWSILNYLDKREFKTYWANTSSNSLVCKLIQEAGSGVKEKFERLLCDENIECRIDEQIVYNRLGKQKDAIWSLLLAGGYLKVVFIDHINERYILRLTNYEVKKMFQKMVEDWFNTEDDNSYNEFIKSLLKGDKKAMNHYMNKVAIKTFSNFDTGTHPSQTEPERFHGVEATTSSFKGQNSCVCFYHGFVLGLVVNLQNRYIITSNRESGYGRYDVMMEPTDKDAPGIIMEFKVRDAGDEDTLADTALAALNQIDEKMYEQTLIDHGVKAENIYKYGFAFDGKKVFIDKK